MWDVYNPKPAQDSQEDSDGTLNYLQSGLRVVKNVLRSVAYEDPPPTGDVSFTIEQTQRPRENRTETTDADRDEVKSGHST